MRASTAAPEKSNGTRTRSIGTSAAGFTALEDQHLGGAIMLLVGGATANAGAALAVSVLLGTFRPLIG